MKFNEDDRAQRLLDIFPNILGQVNVSYVNSTGHIVAWHMHKKQTDFWTCLKGSFKVGLAIPPDYKVTWEYLSDKNPRVLTITPGIYHGYKALEPNSILLYYLTHKYDPSDEFKELPGKFQEQWETDNK
jgi:dTDP-4-dehydrorhamnose 3,5-epimerase